MALSGLEVGRWLDRRGPRLNARTVASELCVAGFRRVCPCRGLGWGGPTILPDSLQTNFDSRLKVLVGQQSTNHLTA
jgi:hypothetical protein